MQKTNYEVEVLINGNPAKEYWKDGKLYIEGRKGAEFSIKIKNNGFARILAIPTVDGLSAIDGKEASYNSGGYIINGYSSVTIDGWRTSDKDVARFYFTNPEDSYAEKKGRQRNQGVIGVAIFREKEHWYNWTFATPVITKYFDSGTTWSSSSCQSSFNLSSMSTPTALNDNLQCMNCSSQSQDLGTGFGSSKHSEVTTASFEKENYIDALFEIYYNTREQLEKIGIDFNERPRYISPQAFPNRYCEPPK